MTENEKIVKQGQGLYIPDPIVSAMINMDQQQVGRLVYHMIEWTHSGSCPKTNEDKMTYATMMVRSVWESMVRLAREEEGADAGA